MSKVRPPQSQSPSAQPTPEMRPQRPPKPGRPSLAVRLGVSVLASWHVLAVFMAPLSVPPTSQLVVELVQGTPDSPSPMQWYLDALYLNHGYHFFAPEPGPGHLIRYQVTNDRNEVVAEGEFPDRKEYWPRLRYHRHFMLTDQTILPLDRPPDEVQQLVMDGYARHLLRQHQGHEARLVRVRHDMLAPMEKRDGVALNAAHKFVTVKESVQRRDDLNRPATTVTNGELEFGAWQGATPAGRVL